MLLFITCHMKVAGYYGFTLDFSVSVCPTVRCMYVCPSIHISFPDDSLSKNQWSFTKLGMCVDIVEIWFGIANGQISSNFDRVIFLVGKSFHIWSYVLVSEAFKYLYVCYGFH